MDLEIAVTGLGLCSPLGDLQGFYSGLLSGVQGRKALFSTEGAIEPAKLRRIPRIGQLCIVAARAALGMAPLAKDCAVTALYGSDRVGVVLGTGLGTIDGTVEFMKGYLTQGLEGASPALFPTTVMNTAAAQLSMELQLQGTNITVNHRDLSGIEAIGSACDQLILGRAEAILAGAVDELGPAALHGYGRFCELATDERPMRPYDRRGGPLSLGEGAAILLLERLADARRRGAPILGVIRGIGRGGDHRSRIGWQGAEPKVEGSGALAAIQETGFGADEGSYIAGSGNGTALDRLEAQVLSLAGLCGVRISSILGQVGESMMSPVLRVASGLAALSGQGIPGTLFCEEIDPALGYKRLCLVPEPGVQIREVLVPCLAQGGGAAALCLTKP